MWDRDKENAGFKEDMKVPMMKYILVIQEECKEEESLIWRKALFRRNATGTDTMREENTIIIKIYKSKNKSRVVEFFYAFYRKYMTDDLEQNLGETLGLWKSKVIKVNSIEGTQREEYRVTSFSQRNFYFYYKCQRTPITTFLNLAREMCYNHSGSDDSHQVKLQYK